jgi:ATP-dependent Lon protease
MLPWLNLFSDQEDAIEVIPSELPILPLRNTVVFPSAVTPIVVGIPRSVKLVEEAVEGNRLIGLVAMHDPDIEEPGPGQVYEVGTVGLIHKVLKGSDENVQVIIQGVERFRIQEWIQEEPYLKAQIELSPEQVEESVEVEALRRSLLDLARRLVSLTPQLPDEIMEFITRLENPRYLIYLVAANLRIEVVEAQEILTLDSVVDKMRKLISILTREVEVLELGQKIQSEAQSEIEQAQRDYFLREQLKAIRKELGEADEITEVHKYRQKIAESGMSEEAEKEALRELGRLEKMPPQAAEHSVIKTYLDWLTDLPWQTLTEDNLDIAHARQVLDEDHYDLTEIKNRMLEFLAVRKLRLERGVDEEETAEEGTGLSPVHRDAQAIVLCFVGPPGTGKTSLGRSVARALGREFTRMSLGGVRDQAEIRGHRRTYIGAMPGRIIQAIKRAGTRNPVFMLDEVDKISADWLGGTSWEVLDPQQNCTFRDHYLDVDFDLSKVMFICTANEQEPISPPLRDRMEILTLGGYTEYAKIKIAQGYLIPRQIRTNGLRPDEITFEEAALRAIIRDHTRESGIRNLEREIGRVCRKVATQVAAGEIESSVTITPEKVREFLGQPKHFFWAALRTRRSGVATWLAETPGGGEVLFVEAAQMPGKEQLTLTGQLSDAMQESARIALSYVRAMAEQIGISSDFFGGQDVHLHIPVGATPKDGPSAGVAMVTALVSLLKGDLVRPDVGLTGEITLRGQVLPIGGTKQKVLAAHRAGLKTVVLPQHNEADLNNVPEDVREEMTFVLVETIDQVLKAGLERLPRPAINRQQPD